MWQLLIPVIGNLLDKIMPDKAASDEAKLKLAELAQQGQLAELNAITDLAKAQIQVNHAEAQSDDWFRAGWRPMIGYVLAASLGYQYILYPLLVWVCALWYPTVIPPVLGMDDNTWELMFGMLGLAGLRGWEKKSQSKPKS